MATKTYKHCNPDDVVTLTVEGLSAREIAERLGVSISNVHRLRKSTGIAQPAPVRLSREEVRLAEMLLEDGCPAAEVARTLGRNISVIRDKFRGYSQVRGDSLRSHRGLIQQLGL